MTSAIAVTYLSGVFITDDLTGVPVWYAGNNTGLPHTKIYQCTICADKTIYAIPMNGTTNEAVCKQVNNGDWTTILSIADIVTLIGYVSYANPIIRWVDADKDNADYVAVYVTQQESASYKSVYCIYSINGGASWTVNTVLYNTSSVSNNGNIQVGYGYTYLGYYRGKGRIISNTFPPGGTWTLEVEDGQSSYAPQGSLFDTIYYWHRAYAGVSTEALFYQDLPGGVMTKASEKTGALPGTVQSEHQPCIARLSDKDIIVMVGYIFSSTDKFVTLNQESYPDMEVDLVVKYPYSDELVFAKLQDVYSDSHTLWYSADMGVTMTAKSGADPVGGANSIPATASGLTIGGLRLFSGQLFVRNVVFSDVAEITGEPLINSQGAWDVHNYEARHASDLTSADTTEHHLPTATLAGALAVSQGGGNWQEKAVSGDGTLSSAGVLNVTHADEADHATNSDQFGGIPLASFGFLDLNDTPAVYTGQGGKVVSVKDDETGLEFTVESGGGSGGDVSITFQSRFWTVDGPLAVADEVGGVWRIMENMAISNAVLYLLNTGESGSTIIDFDVSHDGETWETLFATTENRPALAAGTADRRAGSVPDTTLLFAGDLVRLNIDQVAVMARCLSAQIDGEVVLMSPTLYSITLTTADTEYSQALPAGLRALSFKARTNVAIRWAFATGKVATPTDPYETLQAGQTYFKENLVSAAVTLYLASATAGTVVEVEVWA